MRTFGPQYPTLTTATTGDPLTLAEAKDHLRITATTTDHDADIQRLIAAATRQVEHRLQMQLMPASYRLRMDSFPEWEIRLPLPPLRSISAIGYVKPDGTTATMASTDYLVDTDSLPGRITPRYGDTWPDTREQINAVEVRFDNGYAGSTSVPQPILNAIRYQVSMLYEFREPVGPDNLATLPNTVQALLEPYMIPRYA
jgi:uncharacterized phiE125 gp8 family phage protein